MLRAAPFFCLLWACSSVEPLPDDDPDAGTRDGALAADGGEVGADAGVGDAGTLLPPEGLDLIERLAGLWSGSATRTPLGNFSMMNVDFRAPSDQFMFGRVDVDEENALRFGFSLETHGGAEVLTYRNGGYFLGMMRDDRTVLVEHDVAEGRYRFCHLIRGCDYIDAVYDFDGDDHLVFDVMVRGAPHVYWDARRLERRTLASGLVEGLVSQGEGDAPFPTMPSVHARVTWTRPLVAEAPVWMVLTVNGCLPNGCNISRQLRAMAPAGATSVELNLAQVHAGNYQLLAVLDRNANLDQNFVPDSGDGITLPNSTLVVPVSGEATATAAIIIDLP